MTQADILEGPAVILWQSYYFVTQGPIVVTTRWVKNSEMTEQYGQVGENIIDRETKISAAITGVFAEGGATFTGRAGVIWPHLSATKGTLLMGTTFATMKPLVIWTINDGQQFTFANCGLAEMPGIHLGVDAPLVSGNAVWYAVGALSAASAIQPFSTANHLWTQTAVPFVHATVDFDTSDIVRDFYTGIWGAITGFSTAVDTDTGWDITFGQSWNNQRTQALGTYNYTFGDAVTCNVKAIVQGPSQVNVAAGMKYQGVAGTAPGKSLYTLSGPTDLVISAGTVGNPKITISAAALIEDTNTYAGNAHRISLEFQANRTFVNSATGPIATIAVVT